MTTQHQNRRALATIVAFALIWGLASVLVPLLSGGAR